MSDNINFDYKNLSPFKWFVLENFPFIEADFDALTEWQLFCKIGKEINKIIDSQNIVGEQAETLTNAFNNLKNYVDNYFNNLDVQDEINNKLNEMAQSGELQEIISEYLNSKAIFGFNNVDEMKQSSNLINGSYARTLGFYSKNDGGSALYKIREITNDDVVDNMFILQMENDSLIAELITINKINIKQLGAKGSENNDDTLYVMNSLLKLNYAFIPNGTFYINLNITNDIDINIYGDENAILKSYNGYEIISINLNEITKNKSIHNLNFELINNNIGVSIKLPHFVDNYYPQKVKINNLNYYCADNFTGKCVELNYIRELNISDIYVKRQRIQDTSRTGIGIDCLSCMNLNIKNSSLGFLNKAINLLNGTMSTEGILIDNVEMFFCDYGVFAQSSSQRAILNLRVINCMIDQIQKSGVNIDGITTCNILNNWFGTNVINANSIDINSTNRENFGTIIANNTIWHNNQNNSFPIYINRSSSYQTRNININNNVIYNYHLYAIMIGNEVKPIANIHINNNNFETSSSDPSNRFIKYTVAPNNNIITNNFNGGSPLVDDNLYLSNNINATNNKILTSADITTGSTVQNSSNKTLAIILNCHITNENNGRVSVFIGKSNTTLSERYSQKIYAGTVNGFNQTVIALIPPKCSYALNPSSNVSIDGIFGFYIY